ncbi:UTRA domain-containing protein [Streptomyces formicae]|uniref:UTRA domain-containing protein n=1 Tax=Streptomyces formicae TaxID=1616117 RepID=A0ABY3WWM3_9ACTN|nr:UTRA domain-containing protein [Streptomyces formicae]
MREQGRGTFVAPAKITQELGGVRWIRLDQRAASCGFGSKAEEGVDAERRRLTTTQETESQGVASPARSERQALAAEESAFAVPPASGSWSSRILERATIQAGARIGRRLRVSPAAELVYIARLRLVDGSPMAIEHLHFPASLVPDSLSSDELEAGDLYDHLREHHGVAVHEATQSIEPTVVNETEAAVLDVPVLSPALLIERLTTDTAGRPVEYVHSLYRGDRYRIVSRLALGSPGPGPRPRSDGHHPGIPPGDFAHDGIITSSTTGDAY